MQEIIKQELKPNYVLTTFDNGLILPMPYRKDENNEDYVELIPKAIDIDNYLITGKI